MTPETFVSELAATTPSAATLRKAGLDDEEILSISADFKCIPGAGSRSSDNTMRSLIDGWQCAGVQVGALQLAGEVQSHPRGSVVGYCAGDPVVEQPDARIVCENHDNPVQFSFVGPTAAVVLDGLIAVARFNTDRDNRRRAAVLDEIVSATGETSRRFWEHMLPRKRDA